MIVVVVAAVKAVAVVAIVVVVAVAVVVGAVVTARAQLILHLGEAATARGCPVATYLMQSAGILGLSSCAEFGIP